MPHIPMEYTVDLGKTINVTPLHTLFAMGDDNAHRFAFSIVQDGKPVDLTGCTVLATYTNFSPHGVTVNLGGKIEDGKAVALLNKACYTMEGRFALVVRIKNSVGTSAIFYGDGYMSRTTSDTVIDGDYIIYDVNTLLEKIAEINEATSSANTAAQNANTAAETANAAAGNANTEAHNANTAANAANASAQTADAAAVKIDDMTVSATPLDAGTASAALTLVDGHYHLTLGLPKGDTGATPQISVQVTTGAAGSEASVSVSGTAEEPVIHLTIPRGDTGTIENMTINGKPVESGTITLTAEDLGAASAEEVSQLKGDLSAEQTARVEGLEEKLGKTETAADSDKLGGKAPEEYASASVVAAHEAILGDAWTARKDYYVGDYCISGNRIYRCKTAHTAGSAFDLSYWTETTISSEINYRPDTTDLNNIRRTCFVVSAGTTNNAPSDKTYCVAVVGDGKNCVQIASEYGGYGTNICHVRNYLNFWSGWAQLN